MKEQIIKVCKIVEIHIQKSKDYQACIYMGYFTERFNEVIGKVESLIDAEVERRIAERMPTIEDEERNVFKFSGNRSLSSSYFTGFFDACKWHRSRLSQKTEGGGG